MISRHHVGAAEKISLKQIKSLFDGGLKFCLLLHLFSDQARITAFEKAAYVCPLRSIAQAEIDLDVIGEGKESLQAGSRHKIVE